MAAPERDQTAADARSASIFATAHAIRPQAGKVSTHAVTISRPTPHRTAESRRVLPTPKMAVLMVWVAEPRGQFDGARGRCLGGEAVQRVELGQPEPHRLDNPPASQRRTHAHRQRAEQDDPRRDKELGQHTAEDQRQREDPR